MKAKGGSSPLSRGIRWTCQLLSCVNGIIPALAGNTGVSHVSQGVERDHPRSRGEYTAGVSSHTISAGSSPLSRGIRSGLCNPPHHGGIIPALAGNTGGGYAVDPDT